MTAWHHIVSLRGQAGLDLQFEVNVTLPADEGELPPSASQLDAVRMFYNRDFPDMTEGQAHALLSYREFARLSAEGIFPRAPTTLKRSLAACLAAFISSDERLAQFAKIWSERNFARGTGSPRVKGAPIYVEVKAFADYLEGSLLMAGYDLSKLR